MKMSRSGFVCFLGLVSSGPLLSGAPARVPDYAPYASVLSRHVSPCERKGVRLSCVNYDGLRADPAWAQVVSLVRQTQPSSLSGPDRLAFYINAYNILSIQTVVAGRPAKSINDLPNVWKRPAGLVGGKSYSLDGLEKGPIRAFGNPLYHFALVCAAVSCPDLRREPYTGRSLNAQLADQARLFLANPGKGVAFQGGERAGVSRLFEWYAGEFALLGGTDAVIRRYLPSYGGRRASSFLPYHWELNGR